MTTAVVDVPQSLESIGIEIFDALWGKERDPIPTAVDHAYRHVWLQLIMGERRPGERLSDVEVAAQLAISRTPARQALHRLAQEELVQFDPRRGFWVRTFSADDIEEMYSVRGALEVLAMKLADSRLSAIELERRLEEVATIRARLSEHPISVFLQHDFRLHNLWIHASGNGRLMRMLAALRSQVSLFQIRDAGYPRRVEAALDAHEQILLALIEGHSDQASATLVNHINTSKHGVLTDMFGT